LGRAPSFAADKYGEGAEGGTGPAWSNMELSDDAVRRALVVVAHPDDETLWAGGMILMHPSWRWRIVTLCRAGDPDRAPRFQRALARLGATGAMADLDDGPEQVPLPPDEVARAVLDLAGDGDYDLVLTHGPQGEYTRHLRHVEVSRAVAACWRGGAIRARALWHFAYEDGGGAFPPRPAADAERKVALPPTVWEQKRRIIEDVYGFGPGSWERRAAPRVESFRGAGTRDKAATLLSEVRTYREGVDAV
jgi:LmbE family N-acetylglucosaminyl deacetylase